VVFEEEVEDRMNKIIILFLLLNLSTLVFASDFTIAQLKYNGGGDWYANPSSLPNLLHEISLRTNIDAASEPKTISILDDIFFEYPYIYITGHGEIKFSAKEIERLRNYLLNGGFLHADDNYGLDEFFRREIKKVFPDKELVEVPFSHAIYHSFYDFPAGPPKIHEHHGGPPHGYGIFHNNRLIVFYSYNTDLGDGWESPEVHHDPPEVREEAFKMGINIVYYALTH
jgi:hypothetical protein